MGLVMWRSDGCWCSDGLNDPMVEGVEVGCVKIRGQTELWSPGLVIAEYVFYGICRFLVWGEHGKDQYLFMEETEKKGRRLHCDGRRKEGARGYEGGGAGYCRERVSMLL